MITLTATEVLEKIKDGITQTLRMPQIRVVPKMGPKNFVRQGDLYLTLGDPQNCGRLLDTLQLVPGNTTGSRHCVVESPHVRVYESLEKPLVVTKNRITKTLRFPGPIIIADQPFSISHPKHGWMTKMQAGCIQSWQQSDYLRQRPVLD